LKSQTSVTILFELVDRTKLIRLQQNDPDLTPLFELVGKDDDRYTILSGVLIRDWHDKLAPPVSSIHQIVVPTSLRAKLLHIAHDIPEAGHLGVAKTEKQTRRQRSCASPYSWKPIANQISWSIHHRTTAWTR